MRNATHCVQLVHLEYLKVACRYCAAGKPAQLQNGSPIWPAFAAADSAYRDTTYTNQPSNLLIIQPGLFHVFV
jgi:hypothetical protein